MVNWMRSRWKIWDMVGWWWPLDGRLDGKWGKWLVGDEHWMENRVGNIGKCLIDDGKLDENWLENDGKPSAKQSFQPCCWHWLPATADSSPASFGQQKWIHVDPQNHGTQDPGFESLGFSARNPQTWHSQTITDLSKHGNIDQDFPKHWRLRAPQTLIRDEVQDSTGRCPLLGWAPKLQISPSCPKRWRASDRANFALPVKSGISRKAKN